MRVLVDATAVPADRGGVGRYVDGLLAALDTLGTDLVVAGQRSDADHLARLAPGAEIVSAPTPVAHRPARLAWEQTGLPLLARSTGADVVHSPHYTLPLRTGVPVVVTVHDATFFTDPQFHTTVKGTFFRSATRTSLRRAARVVVPSAATRDELVRVLDADADRVDVAHHGVDLATFRRPDEEQVRRLCRRLGLGDSAYVAFLGTMEPRKNVPALVRAWARAVADRSSPVALVLAGGAGWDEDVDRAVAEVPAGLRVLRPGYLPLADLPGLLGGADVVAYPSHGEGFGLPVLEAMACGAAVLTTRRLSLPEVGGDAVAYTEPDEDAIATALGALLDDPERRRALGEAAAVRAQHFTWRASAEAHQAAYERAAAQR